MGYYINQNSKGESLPAVNKALHLIKDGAKVVSPKFQPNLICVVKNGAFDAAGYCYSTNEFEAFNDPGDNRPKTWLVHEHAAKLSGYEKT